MDIGRILNPCREWVGRPPRLRPQLRMLWPESRLHVPPQYQVAEGFELRRYRAGDDVAIVRVLTRAGFRSWSQRTLKRWLAHVLPEGCFLMVERTTNQVVAVTMAAHRPSPLHPFGGELCSAATDPDYQRKGLGRVVCAATTCRLLQAGYRRIFLTTDDHRLSAINLYRTLGYVPFLFAHSMPARWEKVCRQLAWEWPPGNWPQATVGDCLLGPGGRGRELPVASWRSPLTRRSGKVDSTVRLKSASSGVIGNGPA